MNERRKSLLTLALLLFILPSMVCLGAGSVQFLAGTSSGWDFHELTSDIARNNTVDWSDLNIIAQHWLSNSCSGADQWCSGADIDASTGVDFIDYALLSKDWAKTGAGDVLLQTIYGDAQDSAGNITANTGHAVQNYKGYAMAFTVPSNTALNKATFKIWAADTNPNKPMEVRLFNVTGMGYLTTGHTMSRTDPGSGSPLIMDIMLNTPSSIPYHIEPTGTQHFSDLVIDFDQLEVTAGDYLLTLDCTQGGSLTTLFSIVYGTGAQPAGMGTYPDGTPLPKRATITSGSANTYWYQLSDSTVANYSHTANLFVFQITTAVVNHAPTANAGSDQEIIYPTDTVTLAGAVSDDGLPNPPGVLTTTWSKTSGPGDVTFGDASALNTTATFSAVGTYVLRLTASDSALSAYDEMTVTYRQNQVPVVNAGLDKTVGILDITTVSGTSADDGLPDPPNIVTKLWTQTSGPGTATFTNPSALTTTVSFSETGVYVLRLTGDDSELSAYDEVTITVIPGSRNEAPAVNAGIDQEIVLPAIANLDGTVTDDGMPNPPAAVTVTWTKTSGPGTVTFGNIHLVDTTASFSVDGTYVLRLTASDSALSNYDEVTITVGPALTMPTYYKMVGHFHTTYSDGQNTLGEIMSRYRGDPCGLPPHNFPRDAACVTDHDYISNGAAYTTSTFLGINGVECSTGPHVVGFGVNGSGSISWGSTLQAEIDNVISHGGLPWVAHPYWTKNYPASNIDVLPMMESMTNCNIMAVYNGYCQVLWGNGNSEAYWDTLLSEGKHIWGVGEEDTHGWGNKCGFVCTMVEANALTLDALKDALSNGKMYFYNSANRWAPCMQLTGYEVTGTTLGSTITVSVGDEAGYLGSMVPPVTIKFIGNNGAVLKTVTGTSGSYTITGTENYVRVKIKDSSVSVEGPAWPSTTIWTQPVWVTP